LDSIDKQQYDSLELLISNSPELRNFIPAGKKIKQVCGASSSQSCQDKLSALASQQEQFAQSTRDLQQKLQEQKQMDETIRMDEVALAREELVCFRIGILIKTELTSPTASTGRGAQKRGGKEAIRAGKVASRG
jgi:hypothetical protein